MDENTKKKLYAALSAPFPEAAIERTKASETGRAYDTASVRAQFLANRINETLGLGSYRVHRSVEARAITTAKGRTLYEAECEMTVELGSWNDAGQFICFAESCSTGGGQAVTPYDAKKIAHTNAWKRCCAGFGIGKAAWEGALDEEGVPADAWGNEPERTPPPVAMVKPPPAAATGYVRTGPAVDTRPPQNERSRISSKQLGAIMAISRRLGMEPAALRARIKAAFGNQVEFITRDQASQAIKQLDAELNGNGSGNHEPAGELAS